MEAAEGTGVGGGAACVVTEPSLELLATSVWLVVSAASFSAFRASSLYPPAARIASRAGVMTERSSDSAARCAGAIHGVSSSYGKLC